MQNLDRAAATALFRWADLEHCAQNSQRYLRSGRVCLGKRHVRKAEDFLRHAEFKVESPTIGPKQTLLAFWRDGAPPSDFPASALVRVPDGMHLRHHLTGIEDVETAERWLAQNPLTSIFLVIPEGRPELLRQLHHLLDQHLQTLAAVGCWVGSAEIQNGRHCDWSKISRCVR